MSNTATPFSSPFSINRNVREIKKESEMEGKLTHTPPDLHLPPQMTDVVDTNTALEMFYKGKSTGLLSDIDIQKEMKKGCIIIEPFNKTQMGNCSYNITLGEYYYTSIPSDEKGFHNPWNKDNSNALWKLNQASDGEKYNINGKCIVIPPKHMILAHTQEFIGGRHCDSYGITTMMKSRSSMGRNFIDITCGSAGFGDVEYFNRWTMEIINHHPTLTIVLPVGKEVGQILFFYTGPVSREYRGKYQQSLNIETLKNTWTPEMMLPRVYLDSV